MYIVHALVQARWKVDVLYRKLCAHLLYVGTYSTEPLNNFGFEPGALRPLNHSWITVSYLPRVLEHPREKNIILFYNFLSSNQIHLQVPNIVGYHITLQGKYFVLSS